MAEIHISTGAVTWADIVVAVATSGLLIGAVITAMRVGQQIRLMREQHEAEMGLMREQHADEMLTARRPVLTVANLTFDGQYLRGAIHNPGPGLAVNVLVEAWLVTIESPHVIGFDKLRRQLGDLEQELPKTPRQFHAAPGALGPGESADNFVFNAEYRFELAKAKGEQIFAVWRTYCSDITGEPQKAIQGVTLVAMSIREQAASD